MNIGVKAMGLNYNKQYITKDRRIVNKGPRDNQKRLDTRVVTGNGSQELVAELRSQVERLQDQLSEKPKFSEGFTAEQVNDEIVKAIKAETVELKASHAEEIKKLEMINLNLNKELENISGRLTFAETSLVSEFDALMTSHKKEIASLEEIIQSKDELIVHLKSSGPTTGSEGELAAVLKETTKKIEKMAAVSAGLTQEDIDPNRPKMETKFIDPIENDNSVETHIEIKDIPTDEKEQMKSKVDKLKNLMGKLPTRQ